MEESTPNRPVEAPRGIFPARVDEKGRLKLPVAFQQYLAAKDGGRVFVTSLDGKMARLYPVSVWRQNEMLIEEMDDAELAADMAFIANENGADSELDGQGRVLIHPELRRSLGIENQQVYLDCYRGRVNVYSQQLYEERKRKAGENLADKLKRIEQAGLR